MTAGSDQAPLDDDWLLLSEACQAASREKIAVWCRDGMVLSRAGLRVSRISDLDTGSNDTISEENFGLDPADWTANALGNLHGPHWQDEEAHFDLSKDPIHDPRTNMLWYGGTLYRIQVYRGDLDQLLRAAAPKAQIGRPRGGAYSQSDKAIVEKMRAVLASGEFTSPTAAARHFAGEAKGGGTTESKAKRLARLFKASE